MGDDSSQQALQYQMPLHIQGSNAIYFTNPQPTLYQLELAYRGMMEDPEGNLIKVGERWMNDEGINRVMGIIRSVVSTITFMGNIEKKQVAELLLFACDTLDQDLMMNRTKYGLTFSSRKLVETSATNIMFYTLTRPVDEGDKRFLGKMTQEIHSTIDSTTKNKGGGISGLLGWGRNK